MATQKQIGEYRVVESDVDALGHMNLRRYAELAESAAALLFAQLDEATGQRGEHCVAITDITTRQHREQFLGAHINLLGSVVGVDSDGVTFQLELRSVAPTVAEEQLASTHLLRLGLVDVQTRSGVALNDGLLQRARHQQCDVLETARPRRLCSGPMRRVTYDEVAALEHEVWCVRIVQTSECDPHGWCCAGPTDLAWGPRSLQRPSTLWQYQDNDGRAYGLTNVEHRRVVLAMPRVGTHLQTVAANVAVERNRRVRREWTFDLERGELYAMGEFVDLVVDLEARRAVEIPEAFRTALSRFLHPELAHD
jgi:acyl-CoA thioesterase FadM